MSIPGSQNRKTSRRTLAACLLLCALGISLAGCGGEIDAGDQPGGTSGAGAANSGGPSGFDGSQAGNQAGSAGAAGGAGSMGGNAGTGSGPSNPEALPARVRRLTNAEIDASVRALLGIDSHFAESFTPDTRQAGYTRNDAQRVDPVFVRQMHDAAQKLADMAVEQITSLAPCAQASGSEACAREFIASFATRAYRRPASDREIEALLTVYRVSSEGSSYAEGIATVIAAVLQSPGFLYLTELGEGDPTHSTQLTEHEIAGELSYLLTGAPPDGPLLDAANNERLHDPEARRDEAERLLATDAAARQLVRMVHEWLGIDRIVETAKDSNVYPEFAGLRDAMKREADDFVRQVMWESGGTQVSELFSADWTPAEDNLARMYLDGQSPTRQDNRVSLADTPRRGILSQGAFLAVNAHATESAPVLRGVAVLRRVLCRVVPSPTLLNINVVPPVPDPSKTTRERFAIHSQDMVCQGCHQAIDAVGFTFEGFDGMGKQRTMENGKPVDSATELLGSYSFDGEFADSSELTLAIAESPELLSCFAHQLFHFAAARSDEGARRAETAFTNSVATLAPDVRGKLVELLLALVTRDDFIERGENP